MYRGGKIDLKQIQAFTKRDGVTFISLIKEQGRLGPGWQCVLRTWRSVLQSTSGSNLCDSTWQSHKFTAFHMIYAYIYIYTYISYWVNPTVWPQKSCQGHLQHWLTSAKSLRPRAPRFALKPEKLLGSIQRVTMPKQPSCIQQVNVRTRYQMNFDVAHSRRKDDKRWLTDSLTDYDILWLSHWLGPSNSIELIAMVVLPRQ